MTNQVTYRQDLAFRVAYAMFLERLTYRWYGRIEKLILFLLLLSSMAVVANEIPVFYSGLAVAFLTCWQLIYSPAGKSSLAKASYEAYANLFGQFGNMSEAEIESKLTELMPSSSDSPSVLQIPACHAAAIKLAANVNELPKITFWQKCATWFCG